MEQQTQLNSQRHDSLVFPVTDLRLQLNNRPAPPSPPLPMPYASSSSANEHEVTLLIESGSSHNIVQPRVAEFLGLPIAHVNSFPIIACNGDTLRCSTRWCK
ncbi:UNVERIFIED_CONTAM: hypothetical protein Sradi_1584500 [Sesamum radiatum]|uniref:Uncharacterized protein n=1 Tax=Sesamum radiatum TaxID=300843 RepID=A0AAW2UAJ2_SESRA